MHFRVFPSGQGNFILSCLYFKYFWGTPDVPDIFGGLTVDGGSMPTYEAKMRVPPGESH